MYNIFNLKNRNQTIAVPEENIYSGVVEIKISGNIVNVFYEKNEKFRQIIKSLWGTWDGKNWKILSDEKRGTVKNICAELGNKLLNAGFIIQINDPEILTAAIEGNYEPMHRRWIQKDSQGFKIFWDGDLYEKIKKLPGAKYSPPGIIVPENSWQALQDFAEKYDFHFTIAAKEKIKKLEDKIIHVKPASKKIKIYKEKNILKSTYDIIEDLKDET